MTHCRHLHGRRCLQIITVWMGRDQKFLAPRWLRIISPSNFRGPFCPLCSVLRVPIKVAVCRPPHHEWAAAIKETIQLGDGFAAFNGQLDQ